MTAIGKSFSYDDNGNLTQASGPQPTDTRNFTYNFNDQLIQSTVDSPQTTVSYSYDALGSRIKKVSTNGSTTLTTKYIIDPAMGLPGVLCETDSLGTVTAYYVYGLGLISKISGTSAYFYQYDGLGSTVAITDKTGAIKNKYAYDDFGNVATNSTEAISNPFKYVGKYGVMTDAPDLLYMRARYYIPSVGRFINKDPIGLRGGINLYSYNDDDPINFVDPDGTLPLWAGGAIAGAGIDLGYQIISNAANPCKDWYEIDWWSVGRSAAIGALLGAFGKGAVGIHSPHHGMGKHFEFILKIGQKVLKVIVPGKNKFIYYIFK